VPLPRAGTDSRTYTDRPGRVDKKFHNNASDEKYSGEYCAELRTQTEKRAWPPGKGPSSVLSVSCRASDLYGHQRMLPWPSEYVQRARRQAYLTCEEPARTTVQNWYCWRYRITRLTTTASTRPLFGEATAVVELEAENGRSSRMEVITSRR
jgi:hypothetical protein